MTLKTKPVWSAPVEVSLTELPTSKRTSPERLAFYEDALRRLERTPAGKALRYEFGDYKTANGYRDFMTSQCKKHLGRDKVRVSVAKNDDGTARLYVCRGPAWGKDAMP